MAEYLWGGLAVAMCYVTCVWLLSLVMGRVGIIDAFWGPGFVLIAAFCHWKAMDGGWNRRETVLLSLVAIWGLRLGVHLGIRVFGDPHEDRRYAAMRDKWQPHWWIKSLGIVFLLQGLIMWFVALPVMTAYATNDANRHISFMVAGILFWAVGVFFETVGDWQLARFRANPDNRSKVMNSGLWGLTRHPNYFGDFAVWWGLWLVGISCGAPVWTIAAPAAMSFFLLKVSGVSLLEKDIAERRPGYAEYVKTTNAFFPGRKRTGGS